MGGGEWRGSKMDGRVGGRVRVRVKGKIRGRVEGRVGYSEGRVEVEWDRDGG